MSANQISDRGRKTAPGPGKDDKQGQERPKSTAVAKLITTLSIALIFGSLVFFLNVFKYFGYIVPTMQYLGAGLAVLLALTFIVYPAKKGMKRDRIPWYDLLFILFGVSGAGYIAVFINTWSENLETGAASTVEVVLCLLLIITIIEALRRTVGISLFIVTSCFYLFLLVGNYLPGPLSLPTRFSMERITNLLYFRSEGLFGTPMEVAFTIIIVFMLFGVFLNRSNAGKFIINFALGLTGRWTGGPAKAAVVASAMFGTMSGLSATNVATTGAITIPLMKRTGYRAEFAGAVESVASNGGIITPPVMGAVAFLMAEWLEISYWSICVAAFVPAVLYYFCILLQVHLQAAKQGLSGLPSEGLPSAKEAFKNGWFYFLPLVILVYFLAIANVPPQHAGLYAVVAAIIVILFDWQRKKETRKTLKEILAWFFDCVTVAGRNLIVPGMACASAGIIIGSVTASGMGFKLAMGLLILSGGYLITLLLLAAACSFIFGMGVPGMSSYIILAVLVAPALSKFGIEPLAAHLFILYWAISSFITPPVAVSCFVAAGIAEGKPLQTGLEAMRLGILAYIVPFLFVYNHALLLIGSWGEIAWVVVTSIVGIVFLSFGLEGYLRKMLNWVQRVMFLAGGALLLVPELMTDVVGVALVLPALLWSLVSAKRAAVPPQYINNYALQPSDSSEVQT